ncbi:hypothetical protein KIPB_000546 [Kipferlia bialata]|uniref:Uncharacterized protein n=1 Tax=Kipferlia bialata TaxID=797122 RepID=A0A9K3GDJ3_9EUKA|nr:hypothetical protein KIPB_000546 [Kipferlia bialata]|eukprot:g546.t1
MNQAAAGPVLMWEAEAGVDADEFLCPSDEDFDIFYCADLADAVINCYKGNSACTSGSPETWVFQDTTDYPTLNDFEGALAEAEYGTVLRDVLDRGVLDIYSYPAGETGSETWTADGLGNMIFYSDEAQLLYYATYLFWETYGMPVTVNIIQGEIEDGDFTENFAASSSHLAQGHMSLTSARGEFVSYLGVTSLTEMTLFYNTDLISDPSASATELAGQNICVDTDSNGSMTIRAYLEERDISYTEVLCDNSRSVTDVDACMDLVADGR